MGADILLDIRRIHKKHIIILLSLVVVVGPNRRPTHADNVRKIIKYKNRSNYKVAVRRADHGDNIE